MLSILIPTYNYNISKLVQALHKQASELSILFEIICFDDNSESFTSENQTAFNSLNHTKFIFSKQNLGRTKARQTLANEAAYNWLLFLDSDTLPKSDNFIKHYINKTKLNYDAIYGGFAYKKEKPNNDSILRWKYGKRFEEIDAEKRNLKPYQIIISANFLIKKSVFIKINDHINIKTYGLDNYTGALLKQNNIKVLHINNEVYHFGLESNAVYLNKAKKSIMALLWLLKHHEMKAHDNQLLSTFVFLKKIKLNYPIVLFYKLFNHQLKKNIIGSSPNMILLQLYKLSYICYKDLKT